MKFVSMLTLVVSFAICHAASAKDANYQLIKTIPIGGEVRLEVLRAITDRKAGVVRFDCRLLS